MVGIKDGKTDRKVLVMQKNPIAKDLMNKKKELDKKRLKSMKLLYRLEFLT